MKLTYLTLALLAWLNVFGQDIQRVRIDLQSPIGHTRQLLLGFTPDNSASDDFDYGYDGANIDNFPDDFSWMINDEKYIIQGVGEFDASKTYPIGFFLSNSGIVNIALNSTENFEQPINVYILDMVEDTYTLINEENFSQHVDAGEFVDRYYIAFQDHNINQNLSTGDEVTTTQLSLKFNDLNQILDVKLSAPILITSIEIYNQLGQRLIDLPLHTEDDIFSVPLNFKYAGTLLLKIYSTNGVMTKKFVL